MPRRAEIFLSHAARNRQFVTAVAAFLRNRNFRVWYSERHIKGAQQWHDEIGAALKRCKWFVLVLSPQAVGSRWVKRELLYALQEGRYEQRIVPILYRRCDYERLSWTLSSLQIVSFLRGFENGCRELLRALGAKRKTPLKRRALAGRQGGRTRRRNLG